MHLGQADWFRAALTCRLRSAANARWCRGGMRRFYQATWPNVLAVITVAGHRILQAVAAGNTHRPKSYCNVRLYQQAHVVGPFWGYIRQFNSVPPKFDLNIWAGRSDVVGVSGLKGTAPRCHSGEDFRAVSSCETSMKPAGQSLGSFTGSRVPARRSCAGSTSPSPARCAAM